MRNLFSAWLGLILLAGCSNVIEVGPRGPGLRPTGGDEVGNGGGAERVLFEMGRAHATSVLESVGSLRHSEPDLARVYGDVLAELKTVEVKWWDKPPTGCPKTCGCTLPAPGKVVHFNVEFCSRYTSPSAAGKAFLHEVSHHVVGADESAADRVAGAAYRLWKQLGHPDEPHWNKISAPAFAVGPNSRAVWNGSELVVWDLTGTIAYYEPRQRHWREEKAANHFDGWFAEGRLVNDAGFFVDGKIAVLTSCRGLARTSGAGHYYDSATRKWTLISDDNAPSSREADVRVWNGKLVTFAGESCGGSYARARMDGGIWNPRTNAWEKIDAPKDLAPAFDISWTVTSSKLVAAIPGLSDLWIYDFQTRVWSTTRLPDGVQITARGRVLEQGGSAVILSAEGKSGAKWTDGVVSPLPSFPELNGATSALAMGNGLLARGREFYFFDIARAEWKAIPELLSPPLESGQSWHWTGTEAVVWDGAKEPKGYLYYP